MSIVATLIQLDIPLVSIDGKLYIPVDRLQELIESHRVNLERVKAAKGE